MWLRQAWPGLSVTAANLIVYTQDHIAAAVAHKKLIAESRHEASQEQLICVPGLCQSTGRPCPSTPRDSLIYPVISPSHRCDSFSCCCVGSSLQEHTVILFHRFLPRQQVDREHSSGKIKGV